MSASSSEENYGTSSSTSQEDFNSSDCKTSMCKGKPSTVEKQIDDYLGTWNPNLKAAETGEKSQAEKPEENIMSCANVTEEEEVVCFEQTTSRYLTEQEMLAFQLYGNSNCINGGEWWTAPQLNNTPNTDGRATGNPSKSPVGEEFQSYQTQYFNSIQWGYPPWSFKAAYPPGNTDDCLPPQIDEQPKQFLGMASMFQQNDYGFNKELASLGNKPKKKLIHPLTAVEMEMVEEQIELKSTKYREENEVAELKRKLLEVSKENETLKKTLDRQKSQLENVGPRYKFLEDNFEAFLTMKKDYLRLKEANRKNSERGNTASKYAQTWDTTVMCDFCVRTRGMLENPRFKHTIRLQENKSLYILQSDYDDLMKKFRFLRKEISAREREYENRKEKAELIHLNELNVRHRTQIFELETKNKQLINWIQSLENIICKLFSEKKATLLNVQESNWVSGILIKSSTQKEGGCALPQSMYAKLPVRKEGTSRGYR